MKLSFLVVSVFSILVLSAFFLPQKTFAVGVTISNLPSPITQDPFTLTASISGATNGTNYLRVDIYKDGTMNYFGETFNGTDWYGSSSYQSYLPITIVGNSWNGQVQGRIASPSTSQYDGTGTYRIRVRRYTSSGGYTASEADASSVIIAIAIPTSTPIPTDTPIPTNTPIPTATPTTKPSAMPTLKPTPLYTIAVATISGDASISGVLGAVTREPTLIKGIDDTKKTLVNLPALLEIVGGIFVLSSCGILFYYQKKKGEKRATSDE